MIDPDEAVEKLKGVNLDKPPIHINHADLTRASNNSCYRSDCPVCKAGVLTVGRNQETLELLAEDRCLLCAQSFVYDDIDNLRDRDWRRV